MSVFQEPACHSYLGDNFEDIKNRNILEPGNTYEVLLLPMQGVVLFPGETIPLRIQNPFFVSQIRKLFDIKSDVYGQVKDEIQHLGILNFTSRRNRMTISTVGTTMEIRTKSKESLQNTGNSDDEIIVTGKGRHRFRVLSTRRVDQVTFGKVLILNEEVTRNIHILKEIQPFPSWVYNVCRPEILALHAYKLFTQTLVLQDAAQIQILRRWGPLTDFNSSSSNPPLSAHSSSNSISTSVVHGAELDPVGFSFFLSANLSISNDDLQRLLESLDVIDRLRLIIEYLKKSGEKSLGCEVCQQSLAAKKEVFSLPGAEGMVGAYVNPHGAVHQTITIRQLLTNDRVRLEGRPCAQDSWFPGYAWTIAHCSRCYSHLGWKFTLVEDGRTKDNNSDASEGDDVWETESDDSGSSEMSYEDDSDPLDPSSSESDEHPEESEVVDSEEVAEVTDTQVVGTDMVRSDNDVVESEPVVEGVDEYREELGSTQEIDNSVTVGVSTIREDGRVLEFWGLRRSALKEV